MEAVCGISAQKQLSMELIILSLSQKQEVVLALDSFLVVKDTGARKWYGKYRD